MHLLPKVFRTEGDVVDFDPSKIFESILNETKMSEVDAKKITELVTRRIISSGMKFLSGPHIREIVCSILSEQHFEEERKLYTRIGMPLMDYEKFLKNDSNKHLEKRINPEKIHHWAADKIAQEYSLLRILNNEESKAHLYGEIHIHKLKYFDLRPLSQTWDSRMILENGLPPGSNWTSCSRVGPATDLRSAVRQLSKWLGMIQGEFCGSQSFNFISTFLAPYIKNLNEDEIRLGLTELIIEISQLAMVMGRDNIITSLSFSPIAIEELAEVPAIGPNGDVIGVYKNYNDECIKIFNLIIDLFIKGDYYGNAFDFPKQIVYIRSDWLNRFEDVYSKVCNEIREGKNIYIINLCSNWIKNEIKEQNYDNSFHNLGTLQNISLNLPRFAYMSKDQDIFIETIIDKMKMCSIILKKKYEVLEKRLKSNHLPLCSSLIKNNQQVFNLEKQNLAFNYVGLNEAIKYLTNYELHESNDAFNFGKQFLREMKNFCDEISLIENKNFIIQENLSNKVLIRFKNLDLKHFSGTTKPLLKSNNSYYSNSLHFGKLNKLDLVERIRKQGEFHEVIKNGLNIEEISLKDIEKQNYDLFEFMRIICESSEIACLKFCS